MYRLLPVGAYISNETARQTSVSTPDNYMEVFAVTKREGIVYVKNERVLAQLQGWTVVLRVDVQNLLEESINDNEPPHLANITVRIEAPLTKDITRPYTGKIFVSYS